MLSPLSPRPSPEELPCDVKWQCTVCENLSTTSSAQLSLERELEELQDRLKQEQYESHRIDEKVRQLMSQRDSLSAAGSSADAPVALSAGAPRWSDDVSEGLSDPAKDASTMPKASNHRAQVMASLSELVADPDSELTIAQCERLEDSCPGTVELFQRSCRHNFSFVKAADQEFQPVCDICDG